MKSAPTPARVWTLLVALTLPLYGILVAYATREPQPDQQAEPERWAAFVSSPQYLIEHLLSSVLGAVLIVLGTVALGALLAAARSPRLGIAGMIVSVTAQVLLTVPGVISTFATPAIGAAYVSGNREAMEIGFSPLLPAIFALALLLAVVGNVLLGIAVWRSGTLPRWAGATWAVGSVTFYLLGAVLGVVSVNASLPTQPVGGVLMAASAVGIAWSGISARRAGAGDVTTRPRAAVASREEEAR